MHVLPSLNFFRHVSSAQRFRSWGNRLCSSAPTDIIRIVLFAFDSPLYMKHSIMQKQRRAIKIVLTMLREPLWSCYIMLWPFLVVWCSWARCPLKCVPPLLSPRPGLSDVLHAVLYRFVIRCVTYSMPASIYLLCMPKPNFRCHRCVPSLSLLSHWRCTSDFFIFQWWPFPDLGVNLPP